MKAAPCGPALDFVRKAREIAEIDGRCVLRGWEHGRFFGNSRDARASCEFGSMNAYCGLTRFQLRAAPGRDVPTANEMMPSTAYHAITLLTHSARRTCPIDWAT